MGGNDSPFSVETARTIIHEGGRYAYLGHGLVLDVQLAEAMAYAEKEHIEKAIGFLATAKSAHIKQCKLSAIFITAPLALPARLHKLYCQAMALASIHLAEDAAAAVQQEYRNKFV